MHLDPRFGKPTFRNTSVLERFFISHSHSSFLHQKNSTFVNAKPSFENFWTIIDMNSSNTAAFKAKVIKEIRNETIIQVGILKKFVLQKLLFLSSKEKLMKLLIQLGSYWLMRKKSISDQQITKQLVSLKRY